MQPFQTLTSPLIPLPRENIDTDQIIPARYLKVTDKAGLAEGLFYGWRYQADGAPLAEFPLNRPEYQEACFLLAGDNFGCGSSREHAVWALAGWGLRAVLSTSFADIFRSNALKNGLLPVIVPPEVLQKLFQATGEDPIAKVTIDLATQTVTLPDGSSVNFPIDPFNKKCLLEGLEPLDYLLSKIDQIEDFERDRARWL